MRGANYIKAKEGYKFILTEFGFENPQIRAKYSGRTLAQYEKAVPKKWIDNEYVKEVPK